MILETQEIGMSKIEYLMYLVEDLIPYYYCLYLFHQPVMN